MPTKRPQIGLDDKWIEDADLEELLGEREEINQERLEVNGRFKEKHAACMDRINIYDIPTGTFRRCGAWVIETASRASEEKTITTRGGRKITISKADAETNGAETE